MSKAVSPSECTEFQAHQWKKDVCVNCSRGRILHSKAQNPVARKPKPRTVTSTTTPATTVKSPPSQTKPPEPTKPPSKLGNAHEMKLAFLADTSPTKSPTRKFENTRQPTPGSKVNAQPTYANTQTSTYANAQVVSKITNGEKKKIETTVSKSPAIHNTGRSISVDATSVRDKPAARTGTDLSRSQSTKEDVSVRGDSTKRNRKNRMSRPAGPPPQAPKSPDTASSSASTDSIHLEQIPAQVLEDIQKQLAEGDKAGGGGGGHYYHKYDVSASMRRRAKQQPALVDIETRLAAASPSERAALVAKIKATLGESAVQDILPNDILPDQIAMPYNIVDVSAQLPKDDRPPRLPSSPAPSKEDSLNRASLLNKKKNAAKKEENGNEPRTVLLKDDPNEPASPHCAPILIQSQLNGHHMQHMYEPINDPNGNTTDDIPFADADAADATSKQGFVRASPVRATAPVRGPLASAWKAEPRAEQRAQSLDHLDLSPPSQPSPSKASPERAESVEPEPVARKASTKAKEKQKKEKANGNSGGFFKKLFGFGRRDSDVVSEEEKKVEEKEPSSGSVEEEPISAATSTMPSTAPSTDDLSSSVSNVQSAEVDDSPPPSISPLSLSPIIRESSPRKPNLTIETSSKDDEKESSDRVNNFVSFSDEIGDILGEKLSVSLNFTEEEKNTDSDDATLIGATSLTDEIMDMLSSFGSDSKGGQKSPIPASRCQPKPSAKPSIPATKPAQRARGAKPTSPSIKPPSPPVPKPRTSSERLGELTIEIEHATGRGSAKSPQVSFDIGGSSSSTSSPPVRQSASQSSLLSDGSGSSGRTGTSEDTATLTRKPRPRSTAVSRKMLNAPPPPPPGTDRQRSHSSSGPVSPISPKPANSGGTSPIKNISMPKLTSKVKDGQQPQSPRHLEISAPIAVTTTLNTAQTLPRPIKHRISPDTDPMQKSVDDLTEYRKKKRGDSVAKHARNKTVTEGIAFDIDALNGEEDDRITQLLENSKEKFVNRALPAPPSAPPPAPPGKAHATPIEDGNNYEFVNTVEGPTSSLGFLERGNYEDIDDSLYSAIPADMVVEEYLQPVNHTEPLESKPKTKPKVKWTPKAAKRLSDWAGRKQPMTESYVMVYANTEILLDKDRPALTISEGFEKMSVMNQQTLHHIADSIFRAHCPQNPHFSDELHFEDFGIGDSEPVLTQGCVCMYRARQAVVQPFNGFLMLSAKSLHRGFLDQQSCHLVSASVLLSDRISAEYFPDPTTSGDGGGDPDHYQLYGTVQTNMAVLHYNTLAPLTSYIADLAARTATRSAAEEYERQVCYCLAQIFCAVLDSYSSGPHSVYAVKTLAVKDIAVVTVGASEEKFLVTNAASQNHAEEVNYETLGRDILTILAHFLHLDLSKRVTEHSITVKSRYSKGLRKFVSIISECRFESLIQGKNLLEYLLWGPCVEDHEILMANSDAVQAFGVWLEVARCKAVTDAAIGQLAKTVYTANRLQFLCCVTGVSLSETAALLRD